MGKTARWFRALLGSKPKNPPPQTEKKKWGFIRSFKHPPAQPQQQHRAPPPQPPSSYSFDGGSATVDPNKHAIAVAAATAAVAEAAVAAAQAAAAVVKLTSSGRCTAPDVMRRDVWAAVVIQSSFRGYLARRALKALKGLVKLQALVRGHIRRKKTADEMRCMQAMARLQSKARAGRTHNVKQSISHQPGPVTPEKYERTIRSNSTNSTRHERSSSLKRSNSKTANRNIFDWDKTQLGRNCMDYQPDQRPWDYYSEGQKKYGSMDDDKSDKILEIDPGKPHFTTKHRHLSYSAQHALVLERLRCMDSPSKDSTTAHLSSSSQSSDEVQSRDTRRQQIVVNEEAFCTAENSPQFHSAKSIPGSSKRSPFTPTKSDCSRSFQSVYSDYPNYMSNTASSKAKVRSQSAPKQRLEFEKCSSARRFTGYGDARPPSAQRASVVQSSFATKAYPGSGRLDRLGMPIQYESAGLGGVYRNRY